MKLFSFKILALAFTVITAPVNAYWGHTYVNAYINAIDYTLFGQRVAVANLQKDLKVKENDIDQNMMRIINGSVYLIDIDTINLHGGLPVLNCCLRIKDAPKRHKMIILTSLVIAATVAYKTYKYFTKPAIDAPEEGEIVEANETTPEVA